jgi:hypothetical protein
VVAARVIYEVEKASAKSVADKDLP